MNNYCNLCGKYYYGFGHLCNSQGGTTAGPLPSYTPWSQPIYQYAQDLCGGHCWCKEEMVGEIAHEVCCNCGLKKKKFNS